MSSLVTIPTAFVVALVTTIVDLYLVGHGHQSINREVLTWPRAGVYLSPAGIIVLAAAFAAGVATWLLLRRRDGVPGRPS